jgi:A/G-specific adenine glycosylase
MLGSLLAWFDAHARPLAWRSEGRDPFAVLVAETMLQQTQAARVEEPFRAFMARFPDPATLASADEDDVLRYWQGLGYYRRARRLRAAAAILCADHDGRVPRDRVALARLPGVGRYTATAVAAQAYGVPGVAVDANVRRLGARLLGRTSAPATAREDVELEGALALFLGIDDGVGGRAGATVEALMELGARVCTPRAPGCATCPLARSCAARASGDPLRFGRRRPPAPRRGEALLVRVVCDGARVALERRPTDGRWGGLWGFPTLPASKGAPAEGPAGGPQGDAGGRTLPPLQHVLTHRTLTLTPVVIETVAPEDAVWVELEALAEGRSPVPVASVDRKVARAVIAAFAAPGRPAPEATA